MTHVGHQLVSFSHIKPLGLLRFGLELAHVNSAFMLDDSEHPVLGFFIRRCRNGREHAAPTNKIGVGRSLFEIIENLSDKNK
jgi:hypothetical protein